MGLETRSVWFHSQSCQQAFSSASHVTALHLDFCPLNLNSRPEFMSASSCPPQPPCLDTWDRPHLQESARQWLVTPVRLGFPLCLHLHPLPASAAWGG